VYVWTFTTTICLFFQIIDVACTEEAKDRKKNMESPNLCMFVEVGLDEIPLTSSFDFRIF
jgi:hypothetical protein